jgi:hypothetical protein
MKVVYVAGPFRGPNAWEVEINIRAAECLGYRVAEIGAMPVIPHANSRFFNGTLTDRFWLDGTLELLLRCDAAIFTDDWKRSSGATKEHAICKDLEIPCFYDIGDLDAWLRLGASSRSELRIEARQLAEGRSSKELVELIAALEVYRVAA